MSAVDDTITPDPPSTAHDTTPVADVAYRTTCDRCGTATPLCSTVAEALVAADACCTPTTPQGARR